jgi:membrane protease YdiL (CAAX protease family)
MKIKTLLTKHAALSYFVLTFIFTWGSIFLVVGSVGFPISAEKIESAGPMVYMGMLIGPSMAGLLMIGLADGRAGYRALLSRLGKWRVGIHWYAIALLTVPLLVITILYILSLTSLEFLPAVSTADDKVSLLVTGVVMGLVVGLFEELGWTGFVVPRLRQRYGVLAVGLIVGLLWGAWHYPPFSASGSAAGTLPPAVYLSILLFSFLPAYRVLLVWVYDQTKSLLVVVLMHAPLSACQLILIPPTLSGSKLVTYNLVFTAALWIIAAVVLITKPGTRSIPQASGVDA